MYFTYKVKQKRHTSALQYSFQDVYNNTLPENVDIPDTFEETTQSNFFKTYTVIKEQPFLQTPFSVMYANMFDQGTQMPLINKIDTLKMLAYWSNINKDLPVEQRYRSFLIPKSSGGYRRIDAPLNETKKLQNEFKEWLEKTHHLPNNAAHAYVPGRSTKTALQVHQKFESKYFLKLDIKDFFGCHTLEYIFQQFQKIFPIAGFLKVYTGGEHYIKCVLEGCLLDNKLPQGSPASPLITNICMIPIDHAITKLCGKHFRYTRYADDILISSKTKFNYTQWTQKVQDVLIREQTPFVLKQEKTRYGSSGGRNWNLGLMLNKDNNITLGHKKKEQMRAIIHNFIRASLANEQWSRQDTEVLQGQLSYLRAIEPEYTDNFIQKTNQKYSVDLKALIKAILK